MVSFINLKLRSTSLYLVSCTPWNGYPILAHQRIVCLLGCDESTILSNQRFASSWLIVTRCFTNSLYRWEKMIIAIHSPPTFIYTYHIISFIYIYMYLLIYDKCTYLYYMAFTSEISENIRIKRSLCQALCGLGHPFGHGRLLVLHQFHHRHRESRGWQDGDVIVPKPGTGFVRKHAMKIRMMTGGSPMT